MEKRGVAPFKVIAVIFAVFLGFVNLAYAVGNQENSLDKDDFLADTLYTDTINLELADGEQFIEIIIARWGANEKASKFDVSIKSTPAFMGKVKLVNGKTNLEFKPHETEKTVVLSFHTKAAEESKKEDLVLLIKSSDKDLVPQIRKIVLPFKGPKSSFKSDVSIIVCPFESDKDKGDEKDKICEENIPVHARDDYKVLVDPGLGWVTPFELRIIDSEKKVVDTVINVNQHLEYSKSSGEFKARIIKTSDKKHPVKLLFNIVSNVHQGTYTVETRTKVTEDNKDNTSLLGTSTYTPSFEGQWQTIGTYHILPRKIGDKKIVENLVLVLSEIKENFIWWDGDENIHHEKDQLGFYANGWDDDPTDYWNYKIQYSLKINQIPEKIMTGQPFDIKLEARQYVIHYQSIWCENSSCTKYRVNRCISRDRSGEKLELLSYIDSAEIHSTSRTSFNTTCEDLNSKGVASNVRNISEEEALSKRGMVQIQDTVQLSLRFTPLEGRTHVTTRFKSPEGNYAIEYRPRYRVEVMTNGELSGKEQFETTLGSFIFAQIGDTKKPDFTKPVKGSGRPRNDLSMSFGYSLATDNQSKLTFLYTLEQSAQSIVKTIPYSHPLIDEHRGNAPSAIDTHKIQPGKNATSVKDNSSASQDRSGQTQNSSGTNTTLTDQSGTGVQGEDMTSIGETSQTVESVTVLDPDDPEITGNPSNKSGIVLPDLIGKHAKVAKKTLLGKGFKVELQAGKAAPSLKKAFTVTDMNPKPGSFVNKGETIKITVFVDYAQQIKIPSISGLSTVKAKKKLEDSGFKVKLKTKGNAPTPDGAFKTIGSDPAANTRAAKGSTITLITFGPYKDQVKMPSLVGLKLKQAEMALEKLGLEAFSMHDKAAPRKEMEDIVTHQEPKAGKAVSPRSRIKLKYYDDYKWKGVMPDFSGLTAAQAREKMKGTGIDVHVLPGIPAPSSRMVNKIYKQSVKKSSPAKEGDSLKVTRYGKTKEQSVALKDCTGLSGTEPFWSTQTGKPGCRCKDGYLIRKDKSGCDKKTKEQYVAEKDCSEFPGSEAYWNEEYGNARCRCKTGYILRKDKSGCDKKTKEQYVAEKDCSEFPGSEAYWNEENGSARCRCKTGYILRKDKSGCDKKAEPVRQPVIVWSGINGDWSHSDGKIEVTFQNESSGYYQKIGYLKSYYFKVGELGFKVKKTGHDTYHMDIKYRWNSKHKKPYWVKSYLKIIDNNTMKDGNGTIWKRLLYKKRETKPALPPASVKKTNSTCDQYYNRLNKLVRQQQEISNQMINNPRNVNKSSCDLLNIARETISLAKKARANGCRIDGNLEQSSRLLIDVYKQICKGGG